MVTFLAPVNDPVNSIILWDKVAPVDPSETDSVVSPESETAWVVKPPEICSMICKLVLVFVPHVPAFSPVTWSSTP